MPPKKTFYFLVVIFLWIPTHIKACSVLYYVDPLTHKIYVVNNEDYWLDVDPYIQINPRSEKEFARLWYGWNGFAQGGVNEHGLFFDAAVTPQQSKVKGYGDPKGNLGDRILAQCNTVEGALQYLEQEKIALTQSHIMFGDSKGNAVVVEWVQGERKLHWIQDNRLLMTNFLLSDPNLGNYPCYRYENIENQIIQLEKNGTTIDLLQIGNTFGKAVQLPKKDTNGRMLGTLYTSFIDITDLTLYLSYRLSNEMVKLDLQQEFAEKKPRKLPLKK